MSEKKNFRNFVRDLLFIDIIVSTSFNNPKNSNEINEELEKRWQEIFPNDNLPEIFMLCKAVSSGKLPKPSTLCRRPALSK